MNKRRKVPLGARFFETAAGNQPCREFLDGLSADDNQAVRSDIGAVQNMFPVGRPLCRKLGADLYEVRSDIKDGICRVVFTIDGGFMILLHGFVKKTQKMPKKELDTAKKRLTEYRRLKR